MFGFISVRCVTCLWNDLVYSCCIVLVRKLAGRCASAEEVPGVTEKCDSSSHCEWSKGVERVGPRLDNLVSERTHEWQQSDDDAGYSVKRREENAASFVLEGLDTRVSKEACCAKRGASNQWNKTENSLQVTEVDDGPVQVCNDLQRR